MRETEHPRCSHMAKPRFTMIVLLVESLPQSLAFYRRLGMEFPEDADERRDIGLDIGDGRTIIWSETFAQYDPERAVPAGRSRIMLEFFVDGHAAVDALYAELTAAGHRGRRAPFLTKFEAYMCLVDDPDRNTVLITAG
jgi:catechol 2,3-dioxygenase-like lactoylglutathione lyase family enzyme